LALHERLWRALLRRGGGYLESLSLVLWPWCPACFRQLRSKWGIRRTIAEYLRYIADRIGPEDAFCASGMGVYLLKGVGWVLMDKPISNRPRKEGARVWYRRSEYDGEIYDEALEVRKDGLY
jgi:hypothetical protein